jgi:hypothetical protein
LVTYSANEATFHDEETASQHELSTPLGAIAVFPGGVGVQRLVRGANSLVGTAEGFLDGESNEFVTRLDSKISFAGSRNIFMAELAETPEENTLLVIEGVKTKDSHISRRFCVLVGVLVVSSVLAVAAWTITARILASNQSNDDADASNQTLIPPRGSVINMTIGDALNGGSDPIDVFLAAGSRDIFQTMLNRTDTTFTLFSVTQNEKLFANFPFSSFSKLLLPLWVGHVVRTLSWTVIDR